MKEAILMAKVALTVLGLAVKAAEALDDLPWEEWWS